MLHNNEVINIEETTYQLRSNYCVRRFTLKNCVNRFQITLINLGANLISCCKINNDKDELIRIDNDENQITQQLQRNANKNQFLWHCHVNGLDTICFTTNNTSHHNSTISYKLTTIDNNKIDCLIMLGKLRSVNHLNHLKPFYFNLNSTDSSIDGHYLHIKGTKLDKFDTDNNGLSFTLTGSDDNEFLSIFKSPTRLNWNVNTDSKKNYDLIYTLDGKYKEASLSCYLTYGVKKLEISIHNTLNNTFNTSLNQTNTQNLCRLRLRINKNGFSFLPTSMYEFRVFYKFYF